MSLCSKHLKHERGIRMKQLFSRVLVALNGSEASIHAAMYAMIMAKSYRVALKAVYVVDIATTRTLTLSKFFTSDEREQYEASLTSDGNHYLTYVGDLAKAKGIKMELELLKGAVWSEIIKASEDWKADAIVIGGPEGHSERGAVYRPNALSSNMGDIINNAVCPVLVTKKTGIEKMFKSL